jgi:quercetin dioxygenase-like cupin family protein
VCGITNEAKMSGQAPFKYVRWNDIPEEPLKGGITRRLVTGDQAMIAQVMLKKGDVVPRHSHPNEQVTYILEGALEFELGEAGEHKVVVRAGEVLVIPADVPHAAVALEDTLDLDVFAPPRQDWLSGTDAYLRG